MLEQKALVRANDMRKTGLQITACTSNVLLRLARLLGSMRYQAHIHTHTDGDLIVRLAKDQVPQDEVQRYKTKADELTAKFSIGTKAGTNIFRHAAAEVLTCKVVEVALRQGSTGMAFDAAEAATQRILEASLYNGIQRGARE